MVYVLLCFSGQERTESMVSLSWHQFHLSLSWT